jgi:hypothetical protein
VRLTASGGWAAIGIGVLVFAMAAREAGGPREVYGLPSPSVSTPAGPRLGACYDTAVTVGALGSDRTSQVPCTAEHRAESYHVGTVDAAAGAQVAPG